MKTIIDLSHVIKTDMQIYPGDQRVVVEGIFNHEKDGCHVDRLLLGSHSGTHIDAPFHFFTNGKRISEFPTNKFVGQGVLIDVKDKMENESIKVEDILPHVKRLHEGCFAILMTGWSDFFGTEKYTRHPYLSKEGAEFLQNKGVSIIGLDALNIDSTVNEQWDSHNVLLSKDILIVENLNNLSALDSSKTYCFSFLPLKIDTDGSPVRAVAMEI